MANAGLLVSIFLAVHLARLAVTGQLGKSALIAGAIVAITPALVAVTEWRTGLFVFFIWIVFEDLLRKFLNNSLIVFALKDLLLLLVLLGYMAASTGRERGFRNPVLVPLLLCIGWAVAGVLNPYVTNPAVPVLGLRMFFFYIPLLYLGYAYPTRDERWERFAIMALGIGALVAVLGIVQAVVGLDFLNPTKARFLNLHAVRQTLTAELPSPNGPFVDNFRFAHYMFVLFYFGLGVLPFFYGSGSARRRALSIWGFLCWAVIALGLFVSSKKAPILLVLCTPVAILAARLLLGEVSRKIRLPIGRIMGAIALVVLVVGVSAWERIVEGYTMYADVIEAVVFDSELTTTRSYPWEGIVLAAKTAPFVGHGTGSASLGTQYVFNKDPYSAAAAEMNHIEGGYATVTWEWGIPGLLLWLAWSVGLVAAMWQRLRTWGGGPHFLYGLMVFFFVGANLLVWFYLHVSVYQNYLTQAFMWFMIGTFFRFADESRRTDAPPAAPALTVAGVPAGA